jgi:DNA repair exonuclease SbcCD nuclease subunit
MISFLVRTDVHINDRPPESRCDDYLETVLGKLKQIGDIAREREVDAVLDNGDFFHNKAASRNSHLLVRKVADLHRAYYPCPVYENPGNHDFPYANVDYVEKQPLGVLFSTGIFERMTDHTFEDGDLKVRVVGFPYKVEFDAFEFDIERGDEDVLIVAAHTYASPTGTESFGKEQFLSYQDLAECTPDVFIFGHLHVDQGIQMVKGKPFFNLGSLTRGSLTNDNLERTPRIGYLRIEKVDGEVEITTEPIPIEVKPSSEVFDLEKHERIKQERKDIDQFIDTLSRSASVDEEDNIRKAIEGLEDFDHDVRNRALRYLEAAAAG